jgi:heme-degrading monooxygenase HmoA
VIVSVLQIPVRAGCESEVVRFYAERNVFGLAARGGGFHSGKLIQPVEPGSPFLVIAEWEDVEAYERWLAAPARAELSDVLGPLLDGDPSGAVYNTVDSQPGPRGPHREQEATD